MKRIALAFFCLVTVGTLARVAIVRRIPTPSGVKMLWTVPLNRQSTNYSCGAAALKSALAYYGIELTEEEIMRDASTTPQNGTEIEPMAALAQKHGLKAVTKTGATIEELEQQLANGQITIVTLQSYKDGADATKPYSEVWDSGHYLVVVGMDATNVYFVDPSIAGHRGYIERQDFLERWHDGSLTIGQMQHPAIFLTGTPSRDVWEWIP